MYFENAHYLVTDNVITKGDRELEAYLALVDKTKTAAGVKLPAYALLPGRALLYFVTPGVDLRIVMRGMGASGRCKYKLIQPEKYAAHLARYLHLQPVKEGLAPAPEAYRWSSAAQYLAPARGLADKELVLGLLDADPAAALAKYTAMLGETVPGKFWRPFDKNRDAVLGDDEFTALHSPHARE